MVQFIKKHKIIFLIVLLVLAAAGYYFLKFAGGNTAKTVYTYEKIKTGTIMQTVSGTGQISAVRESNLKAKSSGKVLEVAAVLGQAVKSGATIAKLDTSAAQFALADARANLETAQIAYKNLYEPADELSLMQAQNALKLAQESFKDDQTDLAQSYKDGFNAAVGVFSDLPSIVSGLQEIVAGASSYVVQSNSTYLDYYSEAIKNYDSQASQLASAAALAYRKAKSQYEQNFKDYKSTSQNSDNEKIQVLISQTYETEKLIGEALKQANTLIQRYKDIMDDQKLTAQSFADTHLADLSDYTSKNSAALSNLRLALQNIESAANAVENDQYAIKEKTKSLAELTGQPDEDEVRAAQLAVAQKERALSQAEDNLTDCTIVAPFDGIIASIDIKEGDEVSSGAAVATIIAENQIAAISLNEVDIAKVKAGQKSIMSFSAIDGLTATGKVAEVGIVGAVSQGVVTYEAVIALDEVGDQVKPGMSVSADIITQMKSDVLLAPAAAVKTDAAGVTYALVKTASFDQPIRREITTGLSDDANVEIIEGLNEGDQVAVSSVKNGNSKTSSGANLNNRSGSLFNMGGMGGPMR